MKFSLTIPPVRKFSDLRRTKQNNFTIKNYVMFKMKYTFIFIHIAEIFDNDYVRMMSFSSTFHSTSRD